MYENEGGNGGVGRHTVIPVWLFLLRLRGVGDGENARRGGESQ